MKKCKIGILLTALAIALALTLTGCFRRRDEDKTTTTKEQGSSLIPSPESPLLPDESETDRAETTQKESDTQSSQQETTSMTTPATTTKSETTTKATTKAETTAKTTTKAETTTKATTKAETTTKATNKPETTTTTKPQTSATTTQTTTSDSTTTTRGETGNGTSATSESGGITDPITPPEGGTTTQDQTPDPNVPESGAGEWIHFEDFKDDHLGAIAFLGRSAQKLTPADVISYFGLSLLPEDITVIDNGDSEDSDGDQWYLILPRYRDTTVRLHEAEEENGEAVAGELLAEGMHPMLVRCDPEDGTPSVFVELTRGDAKISFPLLVDGEMEKPTFHKNMLDISPTQSAPARNRRRGR